MADSPRDSFDYIVYTIVLYKKKNQLHFFSFWWYRLLCRQGRYSGVVIELTQTLGRYVVSQVDPELEKDSRILPQILKRILFIIKI